MLCSCLFARCRKHWVCTSSSCRVWCRKKCVLAFLCACSCTRFFAFQHACLCSACMRYANTMTSLTWNWGVWHEICCENPNLTCSPGICQFDLFTCSPGIFAENDGPGLTVVTVYLKGAIKNYVTMYAIIPNPLWSFDWAHSFRKRRVSLSTLGANANLSMQTSKNSYKTGPCYSMPAWK